MNEVCIDLCVYGLMDNDETFVLTFPFYHFLFITLFCHFRICLFTNQFNCSIVNSGISLKVKKT